MSAAPDTADLQARLARLTPAQRAALAERLGRGDGRRQSTSIPLIPCPARAAAVDGAMIAPASQAQRRMWFVHNFAPESPAYNTAKLFYLHGPLDSTLWERALQHLAGRHEALRTTFELRGTEVMQRVAGRMGFKLETADLSGLSEAQQQARLAELAKEQACRMFDLKSGPLWRACLMRLGPERHTLAVVFHHSIFDGWSWGVFCRDLGRIYAGLLTGQPAELPELRIHYADFAHWQERFVSGNELSRLAGYWQGKLKNASPTLDLPTDRPRPPVESAHGANRTFTLPRTLRETLVAQAQREEVTLFMVLLAAFKVLLFRHSRQADVTVGVPFANRNPRETEALIGCFVDTLPLRTLLTGDPSFTELLQRTRQTVLEAHDHAALPFESLMQLLPTERDLSRSPWFQHFFQLRNVPRAPIEAGPVHGELAALTTNTTKFTLSLHVDEQDGELACDWEYDTALFDADTIDRMAARWETLLQGITAQPDTRITALPLLPADERRMLSEWNQTETTFPHGTCVHQLFEEQAARTPEAVAVVFNEQRLTYRELDARAAAVARHLHSLGAGPETPVGVCVERSLEMVVALLGVLKAGAGYVPLDPQYPAERLAFMVADSGTRIVLTQTALRERLPATELKLVCLDAPLPDMSAVSPVPVAARPDQLAYLTYTSGSTGRPKGVEVLHASTVNFLRDMHQRLELDDADVLLAVTSINFDISVLELFLPLTVGARVVVCPDAIRSDGSALAAELERHAITCLQATPATWRLLLASGWRGNARLLALCGGEALAADLAGALVPRCQQLWNLYGPTETTIWSTAAKVRPGEAVHIGRPLANTRLHILDPQGWPTPIGVPGELFIGGDGLARGYRNRPELTAERFTACPPELGSGRLYRTGDRCRWRADGNVEFLGRLDNQIKLRGYRIEPGEIEAALRQCSGVSAAAVMAREDTPGDLRLVAYLVTASAATDVGAIREFTARQLPEYLIPSAFVILPALPLTPNGKLDRSALPKPGNEIAGRGTEPASGQSLLEYRLLELWERRLGVRGVKLTDNFFRLGGHSLLAARLMLDIAELVGQSVPLASLFHHPTPQAMAQMLNDRHQSPAWASLLPAQPGGALPPMFFAHGEDGNLWWECELARRLGADQPAYGLVAMRTSDRRWRHSTVEEMAADYATEIRSLQPHGPYYLCGYSRGGLFAFEVARQLTLQGQVIALLAVLDTVPLNLPPRCRPRCAAPICGGAWASTCVAWGTSLLPNGWNTFAGACRRSTDIPSTSSPGRDRLPSLNLGKPTKHCYTSGKWYASTSRARAPCRSPCSARMGTRFAWNRDGVTCPAETWKRSTFKVNTIESSKVSGWSSSWQPSARCWPPPGPVQNRLISLPRANPPYPGD